MLKELSVDLKKKEFKSKEAVFQKGDTGDSMYIILEGSVRVHDGEYTVAELSDGEFFGEIALLDDVPRTMSITTQTKCLLGVIQRYHFQDIIENYPAVGLDIIKALSKKVIRASESYIDN